MVKLPGFLLRILVFVKSLYGFIFNHQNDDFLPIPIMEDQMHELDTLCQHIKLTTGNPQLAETLDVLLKIISGMQSLIEELRRSAPSYDLPNPKTAANGYRSFVNVVDHAVNKAVFILASGCDEQEILFELISLFQSLSTFASYLVNIMHQCEPGSLYPPFKTNDNSYGHEILKLIRSVNLQCFCGQFIANHYESRMRIFLKGLSQLMVCYGEWYFNSWIFQTIRRIFYYLKNDSACGARLVSLTEHSGIDFIKAFWAVSESPLMMWTMRLTNPIALSRSVTISKESVIIDGIRVQPMDPSFKCVTGQLISKTIRQGMPGTGSGKFADRSRGLILHVHGGGFVSQSSKSQDIFLRKWASALDVPIFSIEYSLAPAAAFPKPVYQVFYSYCVAVAFATQFLGSTAERVVCTGDSAGGNLILGAMQLCLEHGVRLPDGLLLAYVPLLVSVVPSPSRLLALMDPIIPYGIMVQCTKAYVTGDGSGCNYESLLDMPLPMVPLLSPYICPDEMLSKLPRISLYTSTFDPCLDDAIMFAKKLKKLGNDVQLDVAENLPHGFLNLCWINKYTKETVRIGGQRIYEMLNL